MNQTPETPETPRTERTPKLGRNPFQAKGKAPAQEDHNHNHSQKKTRATSASGRSTDTAAGGKKTARGARPAEGSLNRGLAGIFPRVRGLVLKTASFRVESFSFCAFTSGQDGRCFSFFSADVRNPRLGFEGTFDLKLLRRRPLILNLVSFRVRMD